MTSVVPNVPPAIRPHLFGHSVIACHRILLKAPYKRNWVNGILNQSMVDRLRI